MNSGLSFFAIAMCFGTAKVIGFVIPYGFWGTVILGSILAGVLHWIKNKPSS